VVAGGVHSLISFERRFKSNWREVGCVSNTVYRFSLLQLFLSTYFVQNEIPCKVLREVTRTFQVPFEIWLPEDLSVNA
jgi:hypothetical protein